MNASIDVRILGPIEVRVDANPVDLGGPQPRAVIAHLALDLGRVLVPCWRTFVGAALLEAGDRRCLDVLAHAHDESVTRGEVWWLAETLRLRALAEHRFGDAAAAPRLLGDARRMAEQQGIALLAARLADEI